MLFDLRGRGRRRTIQVIYLGLAVLMGGGLVLFGVGAGNGTGGLLNAFNPSGGSSTAKAYVSQQTKNAEQLVKLEPKNAQAWAALVQDRYDDAGQNSNGTSYTAAGKLDLAAAGQAWQQYLKLDKHPDPTVARLIALAYDDLGDYAHEAQAWLTVAGANPRVAVYYEYAAVAEYQAKNTDLGDQATRQALAIAPKAQRASIKAELQAAKTQATTTTATTTT
jgi:tetratricopeptide (TPR) repeat protein